MTCPSDFTVPENEILEKEDELIAEYRKKADAIMLWKAVGEAQGESWMAINAALKGDADSERLGQACTAALFDHIRELIKPRIENFILDRQEQLYHEHEERIHRRASGE